MAWGYQVFQQAPLSLTRHSAKTLIGYTAQAQEQDAMSDMDFESDDEEAPELVEPPSEDDEDAPPAKKNRSSQSYTYAIMTAVATVWPE